MKKTLLLLSAVVFGASASFAQTNADASQNLANGSSGYVWNFDSDATANCDASHITVDLPASMTLGYTGDALTLTNSFGTPNANGWYGINMDMYTGNCSNTSLDLSGGNDAIEFQVKSDVAVPEVYIYLCDNTGACSDNVPVGLTSLPANTLTTISITAGSVDYTTWNSLTVDNSNITRVKLQFRSAWDATLDGNFEVRYITVGDIGANTITSVDAELAASTSVSPNPASGSVAVTYGGGDASVTVSDLTGNAVASASGSNGSASIDVSGLASGVYVVTINSGGAVATKRLVVE